MLIRTTNSKVGNGLQTDRVKTGRNTLRRHIDGGQEEAFPVQFAAGERSVEHGADRRRFNVQIVAASESLRRCQGRVT